MEQGCGRADFYFICVSLARQSAELVLSFDSNETSPPQAAFPASDLCYARHGRHAEHTVGWRDVSINYYIL